MVRVAQLLEVLDHLWPINGAEDWDNVGLILGDSASSVNKVLLSVDVTPETIREAKASNCDLVISHHPVILRGVNQIGPETIQGATLIAAAKAEVQLIAMHTNADHAPNGVSETLARALGLENLCPLDEATGHGRVGRISELSLNDFVDFIARVLPKNAAPIRVIGERSRKISLVGLVAGSGASYLEAALSSGLDAFITSDFKHHLALEFTNGERAATPALIDISHWSAERVWIDFAAAQLASLCPELEFEISKLCTDPWSFSVVT